MIPQLVTVRYHRRDGRWRRWFVPVVPVVLILSPLLVLALVGGLIVGAHYGVSPTGALRGLGRVLWALPGTRFAMTEGRTAFQVSVI